MKFDNHFEKKYTTVFGVILGKLSKKADDFVRNQMPSYEETINENEHLYDIVTDRYAVYSPEDDMVAPVTAATPPPSQSETKSEDSGTPSIDVIRKHWNRAAVLTDAWRRGTNEQEVTEAELLPGELSAVTFQVGCYTVRSANRVYRDGTPIIRAEEKESWEYMRSGIICLPGCGMEFRQEISARHNANPNNLFTYICHANYHIKDPGGIASILTAKEHKLIPDEYASLFISDMYDHWHKFDPTGKITTPDKWRSL